MSEDGYFAPHLVTIPGTCWGRPIKQIEHEMREREIEEIDR